jgi:hypothetical protein
MKLKQKQKYSCHGAKGSCDNNEATFPSKKTGYDRHCHNLLRQVLPRQRLLVYFYLLIIPVPELVPKFIDPPQREGYTKEGHLRQV